MTVRRKKPYLIIFYLSLVILISSFADLVNLTKAAEPLDVGWAALKIDKNNIEQHVKFFSSLDSRVTGYSGFFEAAKYIVEKFKEYGVEPYGSDGSYFEYYNISIPIDHGSSITLFNGSVMEAFKLWPNYGVNPAPYISPKEGDLLVYLGKGEDKDFVGKNLSGKFVLMEFNSRWYFKKAIDYGAKGIIFIGPSDPETTIMRTEVEQKLLNLPLPIPMLYLPYEKGKILKNLCLKSGELRVYVNSNMSWQNIQVPNIVGIIRGSQLDEQIVISAYYDSWSIVPRISPGASEALGISILLDFARFLSENRPLRSVVLVALSGHHQGLWGAREFVERHFSEIGSKIKLFVGMDLSSDTDQIGVFSIGSSYTFFNLQNFNLKYGALINKFFRTYLGQMRKVLGANYGKNFVDGITNSYPAYIMNNPPYDLQTTSSRLFDSDPFVIACFGGGFTYHTVNAVRRYFRTMFDTYERVNFNNVWPQAQFIFSTLWGLANEDRLPSLFLSPSRVQSDWGYTTLKVRVSTYNVTTNYYDPFDDIRHPEGTKQVLVKVTSVTTTSGVQVSGSFVTVTVTDGVLETVVLADKRGEAVIVGLKPFSVNIVDAFVINSTNGNIEWATDLGVYSYEGGKIVRMSSAFVIRPISVFRCGSIAILNLINPVELNPFVSVTINNFMSHGMMLHQSFIQSGYDFMLFVEPYTPVEVLFSIGRGFPGGVLVNATLGNPSGSGFLVAPGECLILNFSSVRAAEEIFAIKSQRYEKLSRLNAVNPQIAIYYDLSKRLIEQVRADISSGRIDRLFGDSYAAWAYGMLSYHYIMDHLYSVISSMVFFFILLVPFSLLVEELLISEKTTGFKRILAIVIIFTLTLGILMSFHPGFQLAINVPILLASVGMAALVSLILMVVFSEFIITAKKLRKSLGGYHFVEISRGSIISQSLSIGVRYMKKRIFRCILTLASLAIIVSSLITFTSISLAPSPLKERVSGEATYQGILLRRFPWGPIPELFYHQIKSQLEDICDVIPRGWIYPPPPPAGTESRIFFGPKQIASISAILALSPKESEVTSINRILAPGSRWFTDEDIFACIVSNRFIDMLEKEMEQDIEIGSQISLWGLNLTIIGIFDGASLWSGSEGILDLDQEPITPVQQQAAGAITILPPHLNGNDVIIVPYKLFEMLHFQSADPVSIVIKPRIQSNIDIISNLVDQFVLRMPLRIYYSDREGGIVLIRPFQWFTATGIANLLLPLVIGALTMLNIMIAQVYERIRDIKVYNAVGLSPSHIMGLFLAESSVYGVVSGVIGYELGISVAFIFSHLNLYPPGFYLNYSSAFVIVVASIALAVSILSGLYPAYIASKIEIPSLERKWKIPPPKGDLWEVSLPFVVTEVESLSLLAFLKEYLEQHSTEQAGLFTVEKVKFMRERIDSKDVMQLSSTIHIAPYDMGIYQDFIVEVSSVDATRYNVTLRIGRKSGVQDIWIKSNKTFIDMIRKQILIWRTLRPSEKEIYDKMGLGLRSYMLGDKNE